MNKIIFKSISNNLLLSKAAPYKIVYKIDGVYVSLRMFRIYRRLRNW